jgi:hypothetical protein
LGGLETNQVLEISQDVAGISGAEVIQHSMRVSFSVSFPSDGLPSRPRREQ